MSDPAHSDNDFKNEMALAWTTLKILSKRFIQIESNVKTQIENENAILLNEVYS